MLALRWYVNRKGYPYTFDWPHDRAGPLTVRLHHIVLEDPQAVRVDHVNRDPLDRPPFRRRQVRLALALQRGDPALQAALCS